MTVFNGERYLKSAIESCLNQTHTNFELIIIDDGSSDKSRSIINSFSDHRIRLLLNEANRGQSYSRNRGIRESIGAYIAIMDGDDICYNNRLEKQLDFLISSQVDICFSWVDIIDSEGNRIGIKKTTGNRNLLKAQLIFECPLVHPTAFWRKDSFIKNDLWYDEYFTYAQDYELWTRVIKLFEIGVYQEPLIMFRFGNELSISKTKTSLQEKFRLSVSNREISSLCGREIEYANSIIGVTKIYKRYKGINKTCSDVKRYFRNLTNKHFDRYPYRVKKLIQKVIIR
jgi:glycosyltransferase involved in cell wall biosynthesis